MVRVLTSRAELDAKLRASPGVQRKLDNIADRVVVEARQIGLRRAHDEGRYIAGIRRLPAPPGSARAVATDPKSTWLEQGTGVYGPERQPIRPKRGKYLVFRLDKKQGAAAPLIRLPGGGSVAGSRDPKEPGDLVFATQVRGRPASWVMRDAAAAVAAAIGARFRNLRSFRG